jgi:hypothetical protein
VAPDARDPEAPANFNSKDQLMRPPARLILSGAALLVAVSCVNDASVAPSLSAPPTASPALKSIVVPASSDFVIPAAGGRISIAGFYTLDVPANAVCDPNAQDSQDGYAAGAWDSDCTPATTDITVHVTMQWSHNRLWADFSPALRFVPAAIVTLSTDITSSGVRNYAGYDALGRAFDNSNGRSRMWGILYSTQIDGIPSDDSRADPAVTTAVDFSTGKISRRVKHFSGYSILTNMECTVSPDDPYCIEIGGT